VNECMCMCMCVCMCVCVRVRERASMRVCISRLVFDVFAVLLGPSVVCVRESG